MESKLKPLMSRGIIKVIEKQLLDLGKKKSKISILEWGSGGSTVYFSDFLNKNNINYDWVSIEYNKGWYEKVKDFVKDIPNIKMALFDAGNDSLKQRYLDMSEYVNYPATLGKKFDFILVDGRKRRLCLIEAQRILATNGAVFLHDAQRKYYHCALQSYPDSFFVSPYLWRGRNEEVVFIRKIFNKIMYFLWKPVYYAHYVSIMILRKIFRFLFPLKEL